MTQEDRMMFTGFIGWLIKDNKVYVPIQYMPHLSLHSDKDYVAVSIDQLHFDKSWDILMPVVFKLSSTANPIETFELDTLSIDNVYSRCYKLLKERKRIVPIVYDDVFLEELVDITNDITSRLIAADAWVVNTRSFPTTMIRWTKEFHQFFNEAVATGTHDESEYLNIVDLFCQDKFKNNLVRGSSNEEGAFVTYKETKRI